MKENKGGFLLRDVAQIKRWAGISGIGFVVYLAVAAILPVIAGPVAAVFAVAAVRAFLSALDGREKDKEAVSYSLLWGTGAVTLMLVAFAFLEFRLLLT